MSKPLNNKPKKVDKSLLLKEVKVRLSKMELPKELQLEPHSKITDVNKFLESHLSVVENSDNPVFKPYSDRLKKVLGLLGIDLVQIAKEIMSKQ
jgi:hypothetical protein